jgi:CheY-like chemotaxis protein
LRLLDDILDVSRIEAGKLEIEDIAFKGLVPLSKGGRGLFPPVLKILLVEDNPVNQKVAVNLLKKRGHTVAIANNGLEAIDKLGHEDFDIVLMDVQMPEMDGFETTKIIRDPLSPVKNHNIRIIAMTAHAMKGYRERCIEGGMNDYISKPLNKEDMLDKIEGIQKIPLNPPFSKGDLNFPPLIKGAGRPSEAWVGGFEKAFSEEIIDRKYLLNNFEEDRESIKKIFDAFMEDIPQTMEDIQKAMSIGDTELLSRKAHFIKGGAGNIGANILRETASALEKAAEDGNIEKAGKLYKKMEYELNRVLKEISNFQLPISN